MISFSSLSFEGSLQTGSLLSSFFGGFENPGLLTVAKSSTGAGAPVLRERRDQSSTLAEFIFFFDLGTGRGHREKSIFVGIQVLVAY